MARKRPTVAHCAMTLLVQTGNWYTKYCVPDIKHVVEAGRQADKETMRRFGRDYGYYLRYVAGLLINPGSNSSGDKR